MSAKQRVNKTGSNELCQQNRVKRVVSAKRVNLYL